MKKTYVSEFFRNNKLNVTLTLIVYIVNVAVNIGVSWYIQVIMDLMAGTGNYTFGRIVQLFLGLICVLILISITRYFTYPKFLQRGMSQYKETAFKQLLQKNISSFASESTSTYISAYTNDAIMIEDNYLKTIFELIQMVIMFIGAFALMLFYSGRLAIVAVLLSILPLMVSILTGNKLAIKEENVSNQNEIYVASIKDILSGFSVVKSFQAEKEIGKLFDENNTKLEDAKYSRNQTMEFIQSIGSIAQVIAQLGVMIVGAWMVLNQVGTLTAGMVMAFTNLMNFVIQPLALIPQLLAQRKAGIALIEKLANNLQHHVKDEGIELEDINNPPALTVDQVNYAYQDGKVALKNVSYVFEPKKSYAIVGGSGAGKSTLLNLFMGSDHNYEGDVFVGEININDLSKSSLYQLVALIQQNVFIFNATLRENITMFKSFPDHRVEKVIELSGLSQLLQERGEDFLAGENGNKLSGGEKQRIAIARALLRDSKILLVDEATSALDNQTAQQINQVILDLEEVTRIVVTHRLERNILKQYDEVLVLKDGELIEHGKFDELMDRKQYFYSLFMVSN